MPASTSMKIIEYQPCGAGRTRALDRNFLQVKLTVILLAAAFWFGAALMEPGAALGQNTVDGLISGDQCGDTTKCPLLSGDVSDGVMTFTSNGYINDGMSSIYGGYTSDGGAYNNQVLFEGTFAGGRIYGGSAWNGDAFGNSVTITGGSVSGITYGGYTNNGQSRANLVEIKNGQINHNVYGGYILVQGQAIENIVRISGGTLNYYVYGGWANVGDVLANRVEITSGQINLQVYGGQSNTNGRADQNVVKISGGNVNGSVWGGYSGQGTADFNQVEISGGTLSRAVIGGQGGDGYGASGNSVTIGRGASVAMDVTGGQVTAGGSGRVDGNTVTIENSGVIVGAVTGGLINSGGGSANSADNNVVTVSGGTVNGSVYGGRLLSSDGSAAGNQVRLTGLQVIVDVAGGQVDNGRADGNIVTVSGGTVGGSVFGGRIMDSSGSADGNLVDLAAQVSGSVYGGYNNGDGSAIYNTVILRGGTVIGGEVLGGWSQTAGHDVKTGNRLSVAGFQGSLTRLDNFEYYDFHLPASLSDGQTLITITGAAATDLTGSKLGPMTIDMASSLVVGHKVTLIDLVEGDFEAVEVQASKGAATLYLTTVLVEGRELVARLSAILANPQTKALAQASLAGVTLINQGADLALDQGRDSALTSLAKGESGRPAFFTATSLTSTRTDTGSHLDLDGWSLLVGLAWKAERLDRRGWLAGAWFETGRGSYDGYNSFAEYSPIYSSGDAKYYGAGLMAGYEWTGGLRLEAGLRAGRVETDYQGWGYLGGTRAGFDFNSAYYGAQVGLSYESVFEKATLDLALRYIWSRQEGRQVLALDDLMELEAVDSHRLRAGGRLTWQAHPLVSPYAGAWVEHEFDGRAGSRNLTTWVSPDDLKTRGATGVGELGLKIKPGRFDHFSLDLGLAGYTGRREGLGGHLSLVYAF